MVKRILARVLCVMMLILCAAAEAELEWPADTPAQKTLRIYIDRANQFLSQQGAAEINRIFEMYPGFAVLGITSAPDSETPEDTEITVMMYEETLNRLELRTCDIAAFPPMAASLICAFYSVPKTVEETIAAPADRARQAAENPDNSFEEPVDEMNGTIPRVYYAYYPDQYHDGRNWIQMTIIFPQEDFQTADDYVSGTVPDASTWTYADASEDYEGYFSSDDYSHFELFTTPTPEPDSAAAEYDFR